MIIFVSKASTWFFCISNDGGITWVQKSVANLYAPKSVSTIHTFYNGKYIYSGGNSGLGENVVSTPDFVTFTIHGSVAGNQLIYFKDLNCLWGVKGSGYSGIFRNMDFTNIIGVFVQHINKTVFNPDDGYYYNFALWVSGVNWNSRTKDFITFETLSAVTDSIADAYYIPALKKFIVSVASPIGAAITGEFKFYSYEEGYSPLTSN